MYEMCYINKLALPKCNITLVDVRYGCISHGCDYLRPNRSRAIYRYISVLPGLWRKRTGLLLSGPKSSFHMKVLCGPLCFLKSKVNAAIYQEILEHFMLPSADKLYGDADFIFQQDLAPAHAAKGTKS